MKYFLFLIGFLFVSLPAPALTSPGKSDLAPGKMMAKNLPPKLGPAKVKEILQDLKKNLPATKSAQFKAHKILIKAASASAQLRRHAVMGIIQSIEGDTITLVHQKKPGTTSTVFLTPDTIIKTKSTIATDSSVLAVNMRIAAVGQPVDGGIRARLIHIIPGLATGVFNKLPSPKPSPTLSATPSATLTPTVTTTPSPTATPSATPTPSLAPTPTP